VKAVTDTPTCVGLGVSTPEQVRDIVSYADGAIVGTSFIKAYESGGLEALSNKVAELASGLD
jgi:tryptophan synthase alpha chain